MRTRMELIADLSKHPGMTPTLIHVAMSVMLGKTRKELSEMHGMSVSAALDAMKKSNLLKNPEHGHWEFNPEVESWLSISENYGRKNATKKLTTQKDQLDVGISTEIEALEQMIKDLKGRIGKKESA